ncbi:MAG: tyrosine protein phosphatase [Hyphomicrobiaceae bacterium]|nr:MAG: tyrosine protein phosphatase [Hyphomicrobiaceae bacterium]
MFVCPLSHVERTVAISGARHLISLANSSVTVETPAQVSPGRHLRLIMNDIVEPQPGLTSPQSHHIEALIGFVASWDRRAPLLIHCLAGISRSTAGCFIALCTLNPHVAEADIALELRAASATAAPNRLLVGLADERLARGGRMLDALEVMGPSRLQNEGVPFSMPASWTG